MEGNFFIALSDAQSYVPGSTVSGNVAYNAKGPEKTDGINITFNGSVNCKWSPGKHTYTGFEKIFLMEKNLLSQDGGTAVDLHLGWHYYQFSFTLPCGIPSSFSGENGNITHKLIATMRQPHRSKNTCKLEVEVKDVLDLNLLPAAGFPVTCQIEKTFSGRRFCGSGSVIATFKIAKREIVPGDRVPTTLYVDNQSNTTVKECNIYLVGVVRCQTNSGDHEVYDKAFNVYWSVMKNVASGEQRSAAKEIKIRTSLNLPATNFSSPAKLKIISLDYHFKVEMKFPFWTSDAVKGKVPIIVGTVPVIRPSSEWERYIRSSPERTQDSGQQEINDSNYQHSPHYRPPSQNPHINQEQNIGSTSSHLNEPPPYENSENPPPSYEEVVF